MNTSIELKPLFENTYFQLKLTKIPLDDSSYYSKCLNDLKVYINNYNESDETIKEQRNAAYKNLHHFARSQDITKVKYEKMKNVIDYQKIPLEKLTKIEMMKTTFNKIL